jgi:molybdopterin/thiamine biosynthesis adenylyltransferase
MDTVDWSVADPGRLQWELDEFSRWGLSPHRSSTDDGRVRISTNLEVAEQSVEVWADFPQHFPDAPPKFFARAGLLSRHQHAQGGNLCVADEEDWWPWRSAAQVVHREIRSLFEDSAAGPASVAAHEADMAEPLTALLRRDSLATMLVPDPLWDDSSQAREGVLYLTQMPGPGERYLVLDANGLGRIDPALTHRILPRMAGQIRGFWVHVDVETTRVPAPQELLQICLEGSPRLAQVLAASRRRSQRSKSVWVGVRFLEEGPTRGAHRVAWAFLSVPPSPRGVATGQVHLATAQALRQIERQRRIPELEGLMNTRAVVVGAGSVGAPVTVELIRAGVGHLDLYDDDLYDVNNAVRHVLPVTAAGLPKATATAELCSRINPFVTVAPHQITIGSGPAEAINEVIGRIRGAAVVIDTTGVPSVSRLLQRCAASANVPLITAGLTASAYGGEILVSRPGGPCHDCLALAQRDGTVPVPLTGAPSNVTPVACSHPAFIGAGFEATELAAVITRTAMGLIPGLSYPRCSFDWLVINFRREPARLQGTLEIHSECQRHNVESVD